MRRFLTAATPLIVLAIVAGFAAAQRPGPPGSGRARPDGPKHPLLEAFDGDHDGTLTEDEIAAAAAKLKAADADKDGKLTGDELRKHLPFGPPRPGRGPGRFDWKSATQYDNPPLPRNDQERKALAVLDQMAKGPRYANISPTDGRLLRQLTEAVGAKRVVEVGTSTGYSAIWFALALRSTGGKLYTHEIDPGRIETARQNFKKAGVDDLITIIAGDAHETVKQHKEPIDVLFLDADKEGYVDYLKTLLPLVRPGGLILAHNMRGPAPDPRYIEAITKNPNLDTSFVLMEGAGIGVTVKKR